MFRPAATWVIAITLLAGAASALPADAQQPAPAALGRLIMFGVDRTERWEEMTHMTLGLAERTLEKVQLGAAADAELHAMPGDTLIFRWISDRSYSPTEVFAEVHLPTLIQPRGPFDREGKRNAATALARLKQALIGGLDAIRKQRPDHQEGRSVLTQGTRATDILGFLTAASEQFAQAPAGVKKVLVLATDMQDNRHYKIKPDLSGVEVIVYLIARGNANPVAAHHLQERWTALFKTCGAEQVSYRPVPLDAAH